jgi:hypothetical protein
VNPRRFATSTTILLGALTGLTACSNLSRSSVGLRRVDDLVERIEAVHVECELSKATMHEALDALRLIAVPDFQGDIVEAFAMYTSAIDASEQQAADLRAAVTPMRRSAEPFFAQWEGNLSNFASPTMRERSRERMLASRARYDAIVDSLEPVQTTYDVFNLTLSDIALFLEHDFNASSILGVTGEVRSLDKMAAELDGRFNVCLDAARTYVQNNALPTHMPPQVEVTTTQEQAPESR